MDKAGDSEGQIPHPSVPEGHAFLRGVCGTILSCELLGPSSDFVPAAGAGDGDRVVFFDSDRSRRSV